MKVIVTGWAGFIGSNLTRMILQETDWEVHGLDAHTYAARPQWLNQIFSVNPKLHLRFVDYPKCDLFSRDLVRQAVERIQPDLIIHLAAESHVCRSLEGPRKFLNSNVTGTFNLLEACRGLAKRPVFHHVSTDEVYGELGPDGFFTESTPYMPRSPYAATKAASDHLVMAYHHSYGFDTRITNCSNNFGPNQHEEKLIPKAILSVLQGKPITLYGPGTQVRDWIWVDDHCRGILAAIENGKPGQTYLLGGNMERTNAQVVHDVISAVRDVTGDKWPSISDPMIVHTSDRPTDDARYAIDCTKAKQMLAWSPAPAAYHERLKLTVRWYNLRMNHASLRT